MRLRHSSSRLRQIDTGLLERIRERLDHRVVDEIACGHPLDRVHQRVDPLVEHAEGILEGADPFQDVLFHEGNSHVTCCRA